VAQLTVSGILLPVTSCAARKYVREGPVSVAVTFQPLANLHKDHFDVTAQFVSGWVMASSAAFWLCYCQSPPFICVIT